MKELCQIGCVCDPQLYVKVRNTLGKKLEMIRVTTEMTLSGPALEFTVYIEYVKLPATNLRIIYK